MHTTDIIIGSILISVLISVIIMAIGFYLRDKKIAELKDELGETRAHLYKLEQFTFELYEHFKEHLGVYHR